MVAARAVAALRGCRVELAVFVVALAGRLALILRHGGWHGSFGYDSAVYFAASDALLHGRLPYGDFVLLHPPGLLLALAPFAALTHVVADATAFGIAALAFCVLGAVDAVLVVRVARRAGLPTAAAATGGVFYAVWYGAVGAEYLARLEPLGNLLLLLALLAALRARDRPGRWPHAWVGVCLGLLLSVKIWWVVPGLAVAVWHLRRTRPAHAATGMIAGAAVAFAVVDLPFLFASPAAMWTSVVSEQLGRQGDLRSPVLRLGELSSLFALDRTPSGAALLAGSLLVLTAGIHLARRAWRAGARAVVVLLAVQAVVLLAGPSWFTFYADYLAVAASLTVAAAAAAPRRSRAGPVPWLGAAAVTAVVTATAAVTATAVVTGSVGVPPQPGARALTAAVSRVRCVMSDSPMGLIEVDALSRGLAAGCRNWVDVTGRTYGADRGTGPRDRNVRWQHDLVRYLRSGGAVIVVRARGSGLTAAGRAAVARGGVPVRAGGQVAYRFPGRRLARTTRHPSPRLRSRA